MFKIEGSGCSRDFINKQYKKKEERKGGYLMLGIPDVSIWLAYVLCIASAILCVVYGIINWNKGGDEASEKDAAWEAEEEQIDNKL
jgi:hypothetical protein